MKTPPRAKPQVIRDSKAKRRGARWEKVTFTFPRFCSQQKRLRVTLKEWVFVESVLKLHCYIHKNTLRHIAFSAILQVKIAHPTTQHLHLKNLSLIFGLIALVAHVLVLFSYLSRHPTSFSNNRGKKCWNKPACPIRAEYLRSQSGVHCWLGASSSYNDVRA